MGGVNRLLTLAPGSLICSVSFGFPRRLSFPPTFFPCFHVSGIRPLRVHVYVNFITSKDGYYYVHLFDGRAYRYRTQGSQPGNDRWYAQLECIW
ncbi:hypothetical protein F5Y15DRAFT_387906 [Xylariaceae sp. FL0016]|nr:hypothetical protein F5Y15DRAFT_387906 [Xylariaceae sp. FL0016]